MSDNSVIQSQKQHDIKQLLCLDSHIHLFLPEHLSTLAWMTDDNPLRAAHGQPEYLQAVGVDSTFEGFVFVEADRSHTLPSSAESSDFDECLQYPLDEFKFVSSLAQNNEYFAAAVVWAPLPLGVKAMERWWGLLEGAGDIKVVRGVRYLVQDKPRGTILREGFKNGMRWILQRGLAFDLGVDVRSGGLWHLEEAVEAVEEVLKMVDIPEGGNIVINHLGKPDLRIPPAEVAEHSTFKVWHEKLTRLASSEHVYIKLSGAFSELPPDLLSSIQTEEKDDLGLPLGAVDAVTAQIMPWTTAVVKIFGIQRVMFGSDWPVCNIGFGRMGGKPENAWKYWRRCVSRLLNEWIEDGVIDGPSTLDAWSLAGKRAYRI